MQRELLGVCVEGTLSGLANISTRGTSKHLDNGIL